MPDLANPKTAQQHAGMQHMQTTARPNARKGFVRVCFALNEVSALKNRPAFSVSLMLPL